jgi:hypothetical protein
MLNKTVLLLSGFIFGLTCGLDAQADPRKPTEKREAGPRGPGVKRGFTMDGYVTRKPRPRNPLSQSIRMKAQFERVQAISKVKPVQLVPGNDFRSVDPNSRALKSRNRAWLLKHYN